VLRIGTISGGRGAFKLRSTAPGGCYEAIVRTGQRHVTHLWFEAPDTGLRDLGEIKIPELPYYDWTPMPPPDVHDTIASCRPKQFSAETTWPSVHAKVVGQLLRGTTPLSKVPVDLGCSNLLSTRTETDSAGRFRFYYPIAFPDDQRLADRRQAECRMWIANPTLDEPLPLTLRFGPHNTPAPEHQVRWAIPEPDLTPRRVIRQSNGERAPLRINSTVSFSPGVLTAPVTAALELMPVPRTVELYEEGACSANSRNSPAWNWQKCQYGLGPRREIATRELWPIALRVSTGQQQATTGSDIIFAVPAEYATRTAAGDVLEAYARLPLRYGGPPNAFVPLKASFWSTLRVMTFTLIGFHFDDERTPEHAYEAVVVLAVRRR
jgi:hypothetical protein